jgi:hypothetical protein
MSAPTPDDYRAALAMMDGCAPIGDMMAAAWALARAAVDRARAGEAVMHPAAHGLADSADGWPAKYAADDALADAIAALVALAKGGGA